MTDVFISYATEDRERVRKIASALQACGWSVWWDRNIKAGQAFDQVIEHELETAKSVVVLWSKDSISSEWVKNEAATAAERGVLVPALIDNVKLPLEFRRRQTADLIGWDGDTSYPGFQALSEGIAATAGMTPAAPLEDSKARRKASFRWNQKLVVTSVAVITAVGALYIGVRVYIPQPPERAQRALTSVPIKPGTKMEESKPSTSLPKTGEAGVSREISTEPASPASQSEPQATPTDASEVGFKTGVFEFKWPGNDLWSIYRGEEKIVDHSGSDKQALQAGTYTVKPYRSAVFLPFRVTVKPNVVTSTDAEGGIFEFKWPGNDSWAIYRGEEKVVDHSGSDKQALQSGTYIVKPSSSATFMPFKIQVKKGQTTTVP
jgi:hypothetical protein